MNILSVTEPDEICCPDLRDQAQDERVYHRLHKDPGRTYTQEHDLPGMSYITRVRGGEGGGMTYKHGDTKEVDGVVYRYPICQERTETITRVTDAPPQ